MRTRNLFSALVLATLATIPLRAQLADQSPFLPTAGGGGAAAAAADNSTVELRGIMSTPAGTRYCLYDVAKKASQWVGLNEDGPFVVKSADPEHDSVSVATPDGRQLTLQLRAGKVTSGGMPAPQPVFSAPPPGSGPAPALTTVVLKPTPEDEQRRLQAIADEVRRRRLLREQQQQAGAPAAPQPGPPQP